MHCTDICSLCLYLVCLSMDDVPQKKNYERLQKALDSVMSIREMTQVWQFVIKTGL